MFITAMLLILAGEIAYDGWSTQYLTAKGYIELDPFAKWFVKNGTWGQTLGCLVGLGAATLASILPFYLGCPKVGMVVSAIITVLEGANCIRQYKLVKASK